MLLDVFVNELPCDVFRASPCNIGIAATLMSDAAFRAMAVEQLLMVAAKEIGAADAAREQHVKYWSMAALSAA